MPPGSLAAAVRSHKRGPRVGVRLSAEDPIDATFLMPPTHHSSGSPLSPSSRMDSNDPLVVSRATTFEFVPVPTYELWEWCPSPHPRPLEDGSL